MQVVSLRVGARRYLSVEKIRFGHVGYGGRMAVAEMLVDSA
jgi:hypothetical protein